MPPRKTPTSSLSAIELLVNRVRYRSEAKIQRIRSGGTSPTSSAIRTSPVTRLPHEIVETIIAHLAYDTRSLRSCTLTCYSWYIAAVPHLHCTLYTTTRGYDLKSGWPNPLQHMHKLGLLPFVRTLFFQSNDCLSCMFSSRQFSNGCLSCVFSSRQFSNRILRQFSALTNVRRLVLDNLDIPSFMPKAQWYFGHFSPTVRGLYLKAPQGSRRQIICFVGLFEHLQDLEIVDDIMASFRNEPVEDMELTPLFTPPLRGQLKLSHFRRVDILNDMIGLFGGIRFHILDLFDVDGVPLLLEACAKTLTTLHLYPSDLRATSSPGDFDLSRCKSLRTIKVMASSMDSTLNTFSPDTVSRLLKHPLSTITAHSFSQVIVAFLWDDLAVPRDPDPALYHRRRFGVLREAHKVRDFRLVLSAEVWDPVVEYSVRMLKWAVAEERAKDGFGDFLPEPSVTCHPRRNRTIDHGEVVCDEQSCTRHI